MLTVVLATDGGHGAGVVGGHAAHRAVVGHGHAEADLCTLLLFFTCQQRSFLVVDDDTEVLEVCRLANSREQQHQAQRAESF